MVQHIYIIYVLINSVHGRIYTFIVDTHNGLIIPTAGRPRADRGPTAGLVTQQDRREFSLANWPREGGLLHAYHMYTAPCTCVGSYIYITIVTQLAIGVYICAHAAAIHSLQSKAQHELDLQDVVRYVHTNECRSWHVEQQMGLQGTGVRIYIYAALYIYVYMCMCWVHMHVVAMIESCDTNNNKRRCCARVAQEDPTITNRAGCVASQLYIYTQLADQLQPNTIQCQHNKRQLSYLM